MKIIKSYGEWQSPITAEMLTGGSVRLGDIEVDGKDVYWIESCPSEGGRNTIMHLDPWNAVKNLLRTPDNARTRVHEYGGGALHICDGNIFFSNDVDRQVYRHRANGIHQRLTNTPDSRYADFCYDQRRRRLYAVCETHTAPEKEPRNTIVAIPEDESALQTIAGGADFYANPILSPDGQRFAYLCWHHPDLPWDATELWTAEIDTAGKLTNTRKVAGVPGESVFQPQWGMDGSLFFVSDRSGWWNLYCHKNGTVKPLLPMAAEFGLPQWVFRMSTYALIDENRLVAAYTADGIWSLGIIDIYRKQLEKLDLPFTYIDQVRASRDQIFFKGASPVDNPAIIRYDLRQQKFTTIRESVSFAVDKDLVSTAESLRIPSGDAQVQGFFYPPHHPGYTAPAGELPPLMVICHGGPTAATNNSLSLKIQDWTTRGFAVLDINYRGSTGFGRAYRELLNGEWGIADVADCVNSARYLAESGRVDPNRMVISGSSAGGFTVLAALSFYDVFAAGCSRYGVTDMEALTLHTHKFEAKYNDRLIAPYPERRDVYIARSPLYHAEKIDCPVIFFQGDEDVVVPPEQSGKMVEILRKNGVTVSYILFEGEGHGFRQPENVRRALEGEFYFYAQVFGFRPAENLPEIDIDNL